MKSKIILACLIIPSIFACNNQLPNTNSSSSSSFFSNIPVKQLDDKTYNPTPPKMGIIKTFIENKLLKSSLENFSIDSSNLQMSNLSIDDKQFYFSDSSGIFQYDSNKSEIIVSNCPSFDDVYFEQKAKQGKFCNYRGVVPKKGKDNNTYLINNFKVSKVSNEQITDIYNNTFSSDKSFINQVAIDKYSNLYLTYNSKNIIKKINSKNIEEWSRTNDNTDGESFSKPTYIEVDKTGNIYFLDEDDHKVKKMTEQGFVSTVIGGGTITTPDVKGTDYKIPDLDVKLTIDNEDNLYLIEKNNNRILKYNTQTTLLSVFMDDKFDGFDDENKPVTEANLNYPLALTFDTDNNAYIFDAGNKVIKKVDSKTKLISTVIGNPLSHGDGNNISKVIFENMSSMYSKNNNLYFTESDRVRKISLKNGSTTTIAGNGDTPTIMPSITPVIKQTDLPANKSTVFNPYILYIDKKDNIYISEYGTVRKITNDNKLESISGELATARSLTEGYMGNIYFAPYEINKIENNTVERFAGRPSYFRGERGELKKGDKTRDIYNLDTSEIVSDSKGNIYAIVNYKNYFKGFNLPPNGRCIIKISPEGIIEYVLNSNNSENTINPKNLIIDKQDNLYFIDTLDDYNFRSIIRKIDSTGKMTIYAGKIVLYNDNNSDINNLSIKDVAFNHIQNISVDDNGYLYFSANNKIYRIE